MKSLKQFKTIPYLDDYVLDFLRNRLIYDERQYDIVAQQALYQNLFQSLTGLEFFHFNIYI